MSSLPHQFGTVPALESIPLFPGLPGGPELLIGLIVLFLISLAPAIFVYQDATKNRNPHRLIWTVATALGGLVGSLVGALVVGRN